ncbi:MAG: hypothetical protein R6U39_04495 [Candidatus Aegiribacteria sp.]
MKVSCSQCGSEQVVLDSDFFLRCPYCGSRLIVNPPPTTPYMVKTSVTEEDVRRLFPPGMVTGMEMKYFPYLETAAAGSRKRVPCFSQPWQELVDYTPPDGDRQVFDESLAEPGQIIPFNREQTQPEEGRLVFHPYFIVMLKLQGYGEGVLVDGVSGNALGELPAHGGDEERSAGLKGLFLRALLAGLAVSVPVYLVSRSLSLSPVSLIWVYLVVILLAAAVYYGGIRRGGS